MGARRLRFYLWFAVEIMKIPLFIIATAGRVVTFLCLIPMNGLQAAKDWWRISE